MDTLEKFALVMEACPTGILIVGEDGVITFVNQTLEADFGYERSELLGQGVGMLLPESLRESHGAFVARFFRTPQRRGMGVRRDLRARRKDGSEFSVGIELNPVSLDGVRHTVATVLDMTERDQFNTERQALELQALEAQQLKNLAVLGGGVAHRFNNFLQIIGAHAELAESEDPAPASVANDLKEIQKAVVQAAALCSEMMSFSGAQTTCRQSVNLNLTVQDMLPRARPVLPHSVSIEFSGAEGLALIDADPAQMGQLVRNLVTNAAEALGTGGGSVLVETREVEVTEDEPPAQPGANGLHRGLYVVFAVTDTGVGISEDAKKALFEPFSSTKEVGRGLGLAAVFGIVRSHGGVIRVTSEPGRGATFEVMLPASRPPSSAEVPFGPPSSVSRGAPSSGSRGTVLLVDDEPQILKLGTRIARGAGLETLVAAGGLEAIEIYKEHAADIDCVVLDLMMPEMSGDVLFKELRALNPDLPIVVASGYGEQEMLRFFSEEKPAAFLGKPFTREAFQALVTKVIRRGG